MQSKRVTLLYEMDRERDDWVLKEDQVPESRRHDLVSDRIKGLLAGFAARSGRSMKIGRNLALRWSKKRPQIGVDPDVYVLEPPPPGGDEFESLKLWKPGCFPPILAVEVVSKSRADKDYAASPEKYAACGVPELWVLDPKMCGPKARGGPFRIQVWRRGKDGDFRRVYAGEGPAFSEVLRAWLFTVDEGRSFRIADDQAGTSWWMTPEEAERAAKEAERAEKEAERAAKEAERAAKEAERAAKEAALRRVAELEARLAELSSAPR
ncbi:MAG: Uma2 family endonuclease [Polyangiaceae bacterium]|nr:Uma2 family endonuclease [Polyangiaceae bacterium]